MSPTLPVDDLCHGFPTDAESRGYRSMHEAGRRKLTHLPNFLGCQLRAVNTLASRDLIQLAINRVLAVLSSSRPYQIGSAIVGLVTIIVVDLGKILGICIEVDRNKSVNIAFRHLVAAVEMHSEVTFALLARLLDASAKESARRRSISNDSADRTHSPKIRDLIRRLETMYWLPDLLHALPSLSDGQLYPARSTQ